MTAHGTRSRYVMGCRCDPCRAVALAYAKAYYRRKHVSKKVSAQLAREHVDELRSRGLGYVAIGEACDMSPATVMRLAKGKLKRIYEETERRVMTVTSDALKDGALVDGERTRLRLERLRDEGFGQRTLARALGTRHLAILQPRSSRVTAGMESRVERLYRRAMRDARFLREPRIFPPSVPARCATGV